MKTMASLQTLLSLTILLLNNGGLAQISDLQPSLSAHKVKNTLLSASVGDNLTLQCFYKNYIRAKLYWYKQSVENTQILVSSFFDESKVDNKFLNSSRFTLDNKDHKNHLNITNVQISDTAVYHCISCIGYQIQFLKTIIVIVKNLKTGLWINQATSEGIQPGRSVILKCTVHTRICDGLLNVYWFKKSEESQTGLIYTSGGSHDQCERNMNSQTNSCVYNLPIHNVSSEHTGTYYCAVASCGQVLFGNGTRLDLEIAIDSSVYYLIGALVFATILVLVLGFSLCTMIKKYKLHATEPVPTVDLIVSAAENAEDHQENLHYAALSINPSRRQRITDQSECVYSSVRHHI